MAVKGSKQMYVRLIPHNPRTHVVRIILFIFGFVFSVLVSYLLGVYWTKHQQSSAINQQENAQQKVASDLSQQLTELRTMSEVDRQSIEELRQLVMTQKAQLNAAERDLRVYKDLLTPGAKPNPMGISVGVVNLMSLPEQGHFNYNATVQKLATRDGDFSGFLEFTIKGQQAGESVELTLNQVSTQVTAPSIPLSFKYFQTLEGDLTLPPGFVPLKVELVIKNSENRNPPLVTAELDWPVSADKPK
ncbi:MAG: hypothetical protein EOO52_19240 [Gammaproteobacteria bacterium]|nr:MAG: hypothetical protein EOO52_19240 [Gammaproteobacteria bacterium]